MLIRPCQIGDLPAVVRVLTDAFSEHPLRQAMLPGARRRRFAIASGDTALFIESMHYGTGFVLELDGRIAGVLAWLTPERHPRRFVRKVLLDVTRLPFLACPPHGFGGFRFQPALDAFHRNEPSLSVSIAATDPRLQRRGIASTLIAHMNAEADRLGVSVFLETSNARNIPLYRRHGFEIVDRARPLSTAPEVVAMLRPKRPVA